MARRKSTRFKNPPTGLAAYVGRALGKLMAQRDKLSRQLSGVEREIESVRASVAASGPMPPVSRKRQASAVTANARSLSDASRRKMSDAAKRRWAATRTANKGGTGR